MTRILEGSISKLRCRSCEKVSSTFIFSGDTDMATAGLACLTSITTSELVLFEMTGNEWNNYSGKLAEERISAELERTDLRHTSFLRSEDAVTHKKGMSFQEFLKKYKPPIIFYVCPACPSGDAVKIEEQTISSFVNDGGKIICLGGLEIKD